MSVNDFINTYMSVNQLLLQRRQVAMAEENARIARIASVQGISQQFVDRNMIPQLGQIAGQTGGQFDLTGILEASGQGPGVTQRGLVTEGLAGATPAERERLASEALSRDVTGAGSYQLQTEQVLSNILGGTDITPAMRAKLGENLLSRTATGMNTGQLAAANAAAALPGNEQTEGAGIAMGTRASAGEVLNATVQTAGIRAQETGQALNWDIANRNMEIDKQRVAQGYDKTMGDWRDPKWLSEQITSAAGVLSKNPDLPQTTKDVYQRQIFSFIRAGKGGPLDPFWDVPSPRRPGESNDAYDKRASEEMAALMAQITNTPMNPRTVLGWMKSGPSTGEN